MELAALLGADGGDRVDPASDELPCAAGRVDLAVGGGDDHVAALALGFDQVLAVGCLGEFDATGFGAPVDEVEPTGR
jgi:hypothetical protein